MLVYLFNISNLFSISSYYMYKRTTADIEGKVGPVKLVFQGGSFVVVYVACFGVRVSVTFHLTCVHIIFSSVLVAEWPPLGSSCSLG